MAIVYVSGPYNISDPSHRYPAILDQAGVAFTLIEDMWDYPANAKPSLTSTGASLNSGVWKITCSDAQKATIVAFCAGDANYTSSDTLISPDPSWTVGTVPKWYDLNTGVVTTPYSMIGDESFNINNLSPTGQTWYTRLINMLVANLPVYTNVANATNDAVGLEVVGEALLYTITALLNAFRVSKSLVILDMIDALMEQARIPLITNGYWLSLDHQAQSGVSCLVNQMALCYTLNKNKTSPSAVDYNQRAIDWSGYIDVSYYPNRGLPVDSLRHRGTAGLRGILYYYKRKGTPSIWFGDKAISGLWDSGVVGYRNRVQMANRTDLNPSGISANGLILSGDRYIYDHRIPFEWLATTSFGWQLTNYAGYTTANIADLTLEGLYPWTDEEMLKFANTASFVMEDFNETGYIRESVNSQTVNTGWGISRLTSGGFASLYGAGKWLPSLRQYGDAAWTYLAGANNVVVPAWMLVATA